MTYQIGVFIERRNNDLAAIGLELLSEVRRQTKDLNVNLTAVYLGENINQKTIDRISLAGANKLVTILDEKLVDYDTHYYSESLVDLLNNNHFDVFLVGSTLIGRDLAPRVSALTHTGLTADATILDFGVENDRFNLYATRPALGGNLMATIICPETTPQMATVRPGVFSIEKFNLDQIEVQNVSFNVKTQSKVKILSKTKVKEAKEDLTKANIIVAGGRGVAKNFTELKEIANLVGGNVAASRAVIDAKIEPKDRLVGQTGTTVRPQVYFASGISGAIQHIAGMDKSELIIAVNNDPNAAIFDISNVSIIADATKVLPLVVKELKELLELKG